MKPHLYLFILILTSCTSPTSNLNNQEKGIVGNWKKPVINGQVEGKHMEFHKDRSGLFGPVINVDGQSGMLPYMLLLIEDWRIKNDTLIIQCGLQPGVAGYDADGNKMEQNDKPSYIKYVVHEVSDSAIVLEDLNGPTKNIDRLEKTEKIEILRK